MTEAAISIDQLSKTYAGGKKALDDVTFDVKRGEIFGLLGPNGAGKSTLINILSGMVKKTSGSANIWGFDIDVDHRNAKASIGIVPQEIMFDPFFTPAESLEVVAGLYGIKKSERRTMELLRAVHLEDKADVCWLPKRWSIHRQYWCWTNPQRVWILNYGNSFGNMSNNSTNRA